MLKLLCVLVLGLSFDVRALPAIHGERLFRLTTVDGKVSFAFAAAHGMVVSGPKLAPVTLALRQSCQVLLQGDLFREDDFLAADKSFAIDYLESFLSTEQKRTYQRIVGAGPGPMSLKPGVAATVIRGSLGEALAAAADPFEDDLRRADVRTQQRLLDQAVIDPYLHDGLREYFGETYRPSSFASTVMRQLVEDERDGVHPISHLGLIASQAARFDLATAELQPAPGQSGMAAQLRLLGGDEVRTMLDQLGAMMADPGSLFVNAQAVYLLARATNADFFALSPRRYGELQESLARTLLDHRIFFEGDEPLALQQANLHETWFDQIHAAVAAGGAFIALDIERVIPGVNAHVRRTLLEDLESKGITITPLAADRVVLAPVK